MGDSSHHSAKCRDDVPDILSDLPDDLPVTDEEIDLVATHLWDIVAEMLNELD